MKKIFAFGLAAAMAISMGTAALAKNGEEVLYSIGSIGASAYQYDDDLSAVDLSAPVDRIAYGETVYYPLLNSASVNGSREEIAVAEALLAERKAALQQAQTKYDEAVENAADKSAVLKAAESLAEEGDFVLLNARAESQAADRLTAERLKVLTAAQSAFQKADESLAGLTAADFLYVHESDAVDGVKIKTKWDNGGKYVGTVEIEKKKAAGVSLDQKYLYFVAVSLKESDTLDVNDLTGTIQLRKNGSFDYDEMELEVSLELSYPRASEPVITGDPQIFEEGEGFTGDPDEEFTFEADRDSYFTVNTVGQSKLLLAVSSDFDAEIADLYPEASLSFFYGNGAAFNKTGTLFLAADEGAYLYKVNQEGALEAVSAKYDEFEGAFAIRTKILGRYVVSDLPLL